MSESPARKREKAPDLAEFETRQVAPSPEPESTKERPARSRRSNGRSRRRGQRRRPPHKQAAERVMLVHADPEGSQIAVLEEDTIVEHYVTREEDRSIVGNIYLGRVQNVLPGMEASFVDVGQARNGVLRSVSPATRGTKPRGSKRY